MNLMYSARQAPKNSLFPLPLGGPDPEEGVATLRGAEQIAKALRSGTPQTEVARRAPGPLEYGIGMMLFKLVERRHLEELELPFRALITRAGSTRVKGGQAEPINRRTVIASLRKTGLIDAGLSVRAIKPFGSTPNIHQVLRVTERVTQISAEEVLSRNRSRNIVSARFFAMWALRSVSGTSFSVIGEHFGGKDHTTVINAVNQVDLKRNRDQATRVRTDQIVDEADLIGIQSNMELLTRSCGLRSV